jgi:hypothetical protein
MNHHFFPGVVGVAGKPKGVLGFRYDREGKISLNIDSSLTSAPVVTDIINDNGNVVLVCGK